MPPGTLVEDAVILKPRVLIPSLRVESNSYDEGLQGDLHSPGVGAGQTTAPKRTLGACTEAAILYFPWPVPQHISRSARGDQAAFLLVLSFPIEARPGCCIWAAWEAAGGKSPEIWRVVLTMCCGGIWSNGMVLHTCEAVTCKNFIAVKIPLHWTFIQVPRGCYIEKLDCSLLFSCHLPRLHTICGARSSFSSVYCEAQVSAEPLAMFGIKGVWGKEWLVVLSQRPQIIQTRCQVRSGLNSWIMLPRG